eukprot:1988338-Prymnesium_polylepis.2
MIHDASQRLQICACHPAPHAARPRGHVAACAWRWQVRAPRAPVVSCRPRGRSTCSFCRAAGHARVSVSRVHGPQQQHGPLGRRCVRAPPGGWTHCGILDFCGDAAGVVVMESMTCVLCLWPDP